MKVRIHRFVHSTLAEGPGKRAAIWVQGCPIRCPECAVPDTWSATGGQEVTVDELAERILSGPDVQGVTFAGGEPFSQAKALADLGNRLKEAGLSVVTYTGYVLESIRKSRRSDWKELLSVSDILIDGPFIESKKDVTRAWVGSSNQQVHFLTPRYRHLEPILHEIPNQVDVRIGRDGKVAVNGVADPAALHRLFEQLAHKS